MHSGQIGIPFLQVGQMVLLLKSLMHVIVPQEGHFMAWSWQNSFLQRSQRIFAFARQTAQDFAIAYRHNLRPKRVANKSSHIVTSNTQKVRSLKDKAVTQVKGDNTYAVSMQKLWQDIKRH